MSKVGESEGDELDKKLDKMSTKNNQNQDCSKHAKEFRCCPPDFCDMIGRREAKLTQLEKHKQDLDRRVEMQDLLLPVATMMALKPGDNLPDAIISVIDEQAAGLKYPCPCPNVSLSQHSDLRIRELESTRKKNIARREEAKLRLTEKKNAVDDCLNKINIAKTKQANLEKKIHEIEEKIGDGKLLDINESKQSVQSLGPDDLDYLMKLEELVKNELITKKQLNELEHRQEANMRALELAAQVMSQEKNNEELDGLKGMLQLKSSANQQLAHCICHLEDKLENLESKLIASNQQLAKYININKTDASVGDKILQKNKKSMILPETSEVETSSEILETKDQDVEAVASVESMGVLAKVDQSEKSVQDNNLSVGSGGVESTGTMTRPNVTDQSVQSQEALRADDSVQFIDLPEENFAQNQFQTTHYSFQQVSTVDQPGNESLGPEFIDLPELTAARSQLETTDYNLPSLAPEESVNLPENTSQSPIQTTNYNFTAPVDELQNQLQTIDYNFESLAVEPTLEASSRHQLTKVDFDRTSEGNSVRLDREELENWLETVSNIRARISKCQQCVEFEPVVINLEKAMTHHLGREFVNLPGMENKFVRIVSDTIIDRAETSEILTPPQTISFSVETSTPMPKTNSTMIAPVEGQEQEHVVTLTEETEILGKGRAGSLTESVLTPTESSTPVGVKEKIKKNSDEINSSDDKETSGMQKGVNVIDENTPETSGKFGIMKRNSSDIRNTIENAGNLVGPRGTLRIDERMPSKGEEKNEEEEEEEEPGEIRHNEMLNDEENFILSRGFEVNDKSLSMDSRQNNKNNQNSQSSLTVDKSAGSRILSPDKLSKKRECICLAAWPKMSKKQYEEYKKQTKKSSKREKRDDSKTISTSIAKPVETQTHYRGQPVPNFNCNPCYCDPCGPDCSSDYSDSEYEERRKVKRPPSKRNQAVSAKR